MTSEGFVRLSDNKVGLLEYLCRNDLVPSKIAPQILDFLAQGQNEIQVDVISDADLFAYLTYIHNIPEYEGEDDPASVLKMYGYYTQPYKGPLYVGGIIVE